MFCRSCGKEIPDQSAYCPHCGASQQAPVYNPSTPDSHVQEDKAKVILCIISLLCPLIGWILFFSKRNEKPQAAKSYNTCAWIGFAVNAILLLSV